MQSITLDEFMNYPDLLVRKAAVGETLSVSLDSGYTAVIIDKVEYEMLTQALKLCMEHPEWTITK